MSTPLEYLHVIGTFQGVLLALMLMLGKGVNNAGRILGLWCLFMAFYFCSPLIIIHADHSLISSFVGWGYFIPASFGAFLYLYCRTAIINQPFQSRDLMHSMPLLMCFALNWEFLLTSPQEKMAIVENGYRNQTIIWTTQFVMFLQAAVYLGLSIKLITRFKKQADNTLAGFNPNNFRLLLTLSFLYGFIWLVEGFGVVLNGHFVLSIVSDLMAFILIYSVSLAQWRDPNLFTIDNLTPIQSFDNDTRTRKTEFFDEDTRQKLLEDTVSFMEDQKPFLNSELTLVALAESVDLSSHHLSEILNQQAGKNFYQFVNEYRVNYICDKINAEPNRKLLDLAMTAGFSSKSTFNAVFKQITGQTPSQYRNSLSATS